MNPHYLGKVFQALSWVCGSQTSDQSHLPVSSHLVTPEHLTLCLGSTGWEKMEGAELCFQYSEKFKQMGLYELFSQHTLRTFREAKNISGVTCDLSMAQILDEWRSSKRPGVNKPWLMGQIQPAARFDTTHKLIMVFIILNG